MGGQHVTDEPRPPKGPANWGDRIQLVALVVSTVLVMALGVAVVAFPRQMGVPEPPATPAASVPATPLPVSGGSDMR